MRTIFDLYADKYDSWFDENHTAYMTELLALKNEFANSRRSIEIGIGTARFAQMLNITYGIDLSASMLEIAKDRRCHVALADAETLPFRTGEFDYALLMVTLCFVKHPARVVKEAKRILTKNGKLVIGIIDKRSAFGRLYRKRHSAFYSHARFFTAEEVLQLLRATGFHEIQATQTLFHDPYSVRKIERLKKGHGKGGFVVTTGIK